jgi:ATP-binding cassette, subfamily B, bacterial
MTQRSPIDLAGKAHAECLVARRPRLAVLNGRGDEIRGWWLEQIESLRMEAGVGSHFLQARIADRWVDLLRLPGAIGPETAALVARLQPFCGHDATAATESLDSATAPAERPAAATRHRNVQRILTLLRPFRGSVLLILLLSGGAVAIDVIPPLLQRALVDRVLTVRMPQNSAGQLVLLLFGIVAALFLVRLASAAVAVWKGYLSSRVGTTMTADLRQELVAKLSEAPLAFHDRNQVGMLMSQVAYDTETLHTLVYHMTSGLLMQSLQLLGIGAALFWLNPKLAAITMLPMPLILGGSWYFTRYLQPLHEHYWDAVGRQASGLMGMLSGIRVVKAFVQEDRERRRFAASSQRLRGSRQTVDVSSSTFTAAMGLLFALGTLAVWYVGGRDVLFDGMSLGSLMAFLAYLAMFYTPLTSIAEATTWFASFFATIHRIGDLLDVPGESPESLAGNVPERLQGRVDFQLVTFGYDKSRPVLEDINFAIRAGEMIGVVGRSGSGKSTLVSLIGRLYQPDSGRVLIDGMDVRRLDAHALRRQIGMVPQEPFLFRGSIRDNITYGYATATPEQILLAARQADAHEFVMRQPLAYHTQLGEGGSGLSGGERQRMSIARALLFDPAILILDEATASVDPESEMAICRAVRRGARQRTTIVIAHRLSTLRSADRLLVFDQGRLVEHGTHEELLAADGLYRMLERIQGNLQEGQRRWRRRAEAGAAVDAGHLLAAGDGDPLFAGPGQSDAARSDDDLAALRWLTPGDAAIDDDQQGVLHVSIDGHCHVPVRAVRAFPADYPREFISLRGRDTSGHDRELGLLRRLDDWPRAARDAVERSLARRYLLQRVLEIRQARGKPGRLVLSLITEGGPVNLELRKPGEGWQPFGPHGLLLLDPQGNYYAVPDRRRLPKRQQRLLTLYFGD